MFRFVPAPKAQTAGTPMNYAFGKEISIFGQEIAICRKVYMFTSAAGPPLCTLCAGGEQPASLHYLVAIFGR
ncbi:MAG: hypothetical protein ACPIOQ_72470, partial [Promethearchaeia archaeon]